MLSAIQENVFFKFLDNVITILTTCYLLFAVLLIPIDAYNFWIEPKSYIIVHHLDPTQEYWRFQYLNRLILMFLGSISILFLVLISFKSKENKKVTTIRQALLFGLSAIVVYGYYQWYITGFDH
jgi:phosphoglycerol transferase MdoB-like AlkP superfamily enzyme